MSQKLSHTIDAYFDGMLDQQATAELFRLIESDPDIARAFARASYFHCSLHDAFSGQSRQTVAQEIESWDPRRRLIRWATVAVAAGVVLIVALTVGLLAQNSFEQREARRLAALRAPVAVVTGVEDVQWASTPVREGTAIRPDIIEIDAGVVMLEFYCGAVVHLEGPAEFGINGEARGFLRQGKLVAYVPPQARGFTIGAPGIAILDLGTRFGVEVDPSGNSEVAVFEGKVQLEWGEGDGDRQRRTLGEASAVVHDPGKAALTDIPVNHAAFARLKPQAGPPRPRILRFSDHRFESYSDQDALFGFFSEVDVSRDGRRLTLRGNAWRYIAMSYQVTPRTVLEFEFRSDSVAQLHGIGVDDDNDHTTGGALFLLAGSETVPGHRDQFSYVYRDTDYTPDDGWRRFRIPVGLQWTGTMQQLVFFADDDGNGGAASEFRNVQLYDEPAGDSRWRAGGR